MNKPIIDGKREVHRFHSDAIKRKFKLSNLKGIQCDVQWYNLKPGWGKYRGWGLFEKEVSAN